MEFKVNTNINLNVNVYDDVDRPKGAILIFHGMAEHGLRYNDFAKFLNKNHYIVYTYDHRGHGLSRLKSQPLSYVGDDGFNNIVEDGKMLVDYIKDKYQLKTFIFAHSFGSFVGQSFIQKYSYSIDGIILSGSAKQDRLEIKLATLLVNTLSKFIDDKKPAKLIDKLSFGAFNNKITNPNTNFDWLSRDKKEVDKYISDPLSGYISTYNFYKNLFNGFKTLYKQLPENKNLPIYIISGLDDPVGLYGKSLENLADYYDSLNNVNLKLYPKMRHELINELDKDIVYYDVLTFLNQNL